MGAYLPLEKVEPNPFPDSNSNQNLSHLKTAETEKLIRYSLVVMTCGFHPRIRGSNPRNGTNNRGRLVSLKTNNLPGWRNWIARKTSKPLAN